MTKRRKISVVVASILIALVALCAFRLFRFVDYSFQSPQIAVFPSPDKSRLAYLIRHGALMARTLTLLVSPSGSENDLEWIGSVDSDDSLTFNELVWSSGSNLVAARCFVGGYNEQFPKGVSNNLLTHGYDFSTSNRLVPARDTFDIPEAWISRDAQLEQLLLGNGDSVTVVSSDNLYMKTRKMGWREWREWRPRLRTARDREADGEVDLRTSHSDMQ